MSGTTEQWQSAQEEAAEKLRVRREYLEQQLAAVASQRLEKERELQRLSVLDQSRQQLLQTTRARTGDSWSQSHNAEPASPSDAARQPVSLAAQTAMQAAQRGPDPIERALTLLERAQAAAAHQRTQIAATQALERRRQTAAEQYEQMRTSGEQKVEEAKRELDQAQDELKRTAGALAEAQKVLSARSSRLSAARSKLGVLMSTTRDLLQLVQPVADMQAAAEGAEAQATHELSTALRASSDPAGAVGSPAVDGSPTMRAAGSQGRGQSSDTPIARLDASIRARMRDLNGLLGEEEEAGKERMDNSPAPAARVQAVSPAVAVAAVAVAGASEQHASPAGRSTGPAGPRSTAASPANGTAVDPAAGSSPAGHSPAGVSAGSPPGAGRIAPGSAVAAGAADAGVGVPPDAEPHHRLVSEVEARLAQFEETLP